MSALLPRFTAASQRIEDDRKIARVVLEAGPSETPATTVRATLPGDMRRLRGIPVVGRGVGGASPGTNPLGEALRNVRPSR